MNAAETLAFLSAAGAGILAIVGALQANRSIGLWSFAGGMLAFATERVFWGLIHHAEATEHLSLWLHLSGLGTALLPGTWILFSLTYARENARECILRRRWLLVAAFVLPVCLATFFPTSLPTPSYLGTTKLHLVLSDLGAINQLLLLLSAIFVLVNLERSFRASVGLIRWRIKFMLMGAGVAFVIRLFTTTQTLLYREITPTVETLDSCALIVASVLILRSIFRTEPLVLRIHPSQAVLQGSFVIIFAGVYLFIVGVLASLLARFGGPEAFALKAFIILVAIVCLAVFLQSDRVQLHVRRLISRHFKRPFHDYQAVWRRFTEGTASLVEQNDFSQAVVILLADIFKSLGVSLWVFDDRRGEFELAASTCLSPDKANEVKPDSAGASIVAKQLVGNSDPIEIEKNGEMWAVVLRRCHPTAFHKGGNRVCAPIVSRGEVLGFIMLGDRISGTSFTLQDLDLLKSIAEHVASGLLNVRLSQRLLQSREHEAFQTMAAFFVHDLKNAASTLSLMLQNLPNHFDDPEFRQDALRGVGKSVAHINNLISRLSELRQELKIHPTNSDLNEIILAALNGFAPGPDFTVETDLKPLPQLLVDSDQLGKVLTNILLNAREAVAGEGKLRLLTSQQGNFAVITASDNGCGMSPEFLSKSLFRPFQTTKKNGLGIGMFQSKMIVEAHSGRISVESTPGHGTVFRIFLPFPPGTR
ncbi:MAG: PEP-CTERM system histidine kinase PrsK [Nibricoccus sp.]